MFLGLKSFFCSCVCVCFFFLKFLSWFMFFFLGVAGVAGLEARAAREVHAAPRQALPPVSSWITDNGVMRIHFQMQSMLGIV